MDLAEKILTLRKSRSWTQDQLAEQLDVSRQTISKWESGQSLPELDKITALSEVFNVSTDCLLKPSKVDNLSLKTEMLENQQQQLLQREQKRHRNFILKMYAAAMYSLFLAAYFIGHYYLEIWNASVIFSEFLIATALLIFLCARRMKQWDKE